MRNSLLFCILLIFLGKPVLAQYNRMGVEFGQQTFKSNVVNVSFTGMKPTFPGEYYCDYGPYLIGFYGFAFLWISYSPLSYTFTFANPVSDVRIDVGDLWYIDVISVDINGSAYSLNNTHLRPAPVCYSSWNWGQAIIVGGSLTAPPGPQPIGNLGYYAARVKIKEPSITSVTVTYNGIINPHGLSGSHISVYFGEIDARNSGPVCRGDTLQLWGDTTIKEPGTFHWTGPNGYTSSQQSPVIYPIATVNAGVYTLTYVNGVDTLTDTTHVDVLPGPDMPVITADSPVCAGNVLHLSAVFSSGATYAWTGPNGFTATGEIVTIPDIQSVHAGLYTVTASSYGCSPVSQKNIRVAHPVLLDFTEVACSNAGYDFNGRRVYLPGSYADTFNGSNGCDSTVRLNLVVLPGPEVAIHVVPQNGILCMGDTILLSATGNAVNYSWYNIAGDNLGALPEFALALSSLSNPILLIGAGDNGCKDSADVIIAAEGCCQLWIPNAFSPNGDGINDFFVLPDHGHFYNYRMDIFNRWGQRVFSSSNRNIGWDGTVNGLPADMGTYYYNIVAGCIAGPELVKKGEFSLVR